MTKGRGNWATAKSDCVMGMLKKSMRAYTINHGGRKWSKQDRTES